MSEAAINLLVKSVGLGSERKKLAEKSIDTLNVETMEGLPLTLVYSG